MEVIKKIRNWPIYFLDLFSLLHEMKIIYYMRNGLRFSVRRNSGDRAALTEVCLADAYHVKNLPIKKTDIIIDIGANIGAFSVLLSKRAGRIYAYEPMPDNYDLLVENMKINDRSNIIASKNAISSQKGKAVLFVSDVNSLSHSFCRVSGKSVETETISLKDVFSENNISQCFLLKIDAEGSEYEILYALPPEYFRKIKYIYLECHDLNADGFSRTDERFDRQTLVEYLEANGFTVNQKSVYIYAENKHG
jgi:FkbM family methyltransferase